MRLGIAKQASILSICKPGDTILAARNCHVSVSSGLILADVNVQWVMPEISSDFKIAMDITVSALQHSIERAHQKNISPKAVIIVSPTYFGVCSDVEGKS